jgi:hypothetical protein
MVTSNLSDSITELLKYLKVRFSSASDEALELELKATLRELCVRTNCWVIFNTVTTKSGKQTYDITPPANEGEVSTVLAVSIDGRPVAGWSGDYLPPDNQLLGPNYVTNVDSLISNKVSTVTLDSSYVTNADKTMIVTCALRPARNILFIPDMIGFDFFDTIIDGASARMKDHTNRPYTDATDAAFDRRKFVAGLVRVREKSEARYGKLTVPWVYPQQAPGRRYR